MKNLKNKTGFLGVALVTVLLVGCLISGTFVVSVMIKDIGFTGDGLYHYAVNLTAEDVWEDHKDEIENIDVVGFEMWIRNNSPAATTFNVWVDDIDDAPLTDLDSVEVYATIILEDLALAVGSNYITYSQSLSHIKHFTALKALVETGEFHYYGHSLVGADCLIDSVRVIVTLSASGT